MKKISSPHKNFYVPKEEPIKYSDITIEDVRQWKADLDAANIKERRIGEIEVTDYNETHYKLSGGVYGFVPKKLWNKLLMEAAGIEPNP